MFDEMKFKVGEYVRIGRNLLAYDSDDYSVTGEMVLCEGHIAKIRATHAEPTGFVYLIGPWWYKEEMLEPCCIEDNTDKWFKDNFLTGFKG